MVNAVQLLFRRWLTSIWCVLIACWGHFAAADSGRIQCYGLIRYSTQKQEHFVAPGECISNVVKCVGSKCWRYVDRWALPYQFLW
uniref:Putative secreted peptide n=1 Tax=Anopheles braziliensis TaxID=58242 RepID=A0A2M3ZPL3_9DIPT